MVEQDNHKKTKIQVLSKGEIVFSDDDFSNGGDIDLYYNMEKEIETGEEIRLVEKATGKIILSNIA